MSDMSLEKDLTIDVNSLDAEWINLPGLYFKYREESDYLDIRARKAKMKMEFIAAQLDGQVRGDPKSFIGVEKATEAQIRCYIESSKEVFEAREVMLEIEKKKRLIQSACSALEMKRDALKNLVQLMNGEYFTTRAGDKQTLNYVAENQSSMKRNIRREMRRRMNKNHIEENEE